MLLTPKTIGCSGSHMLRNPWIHWETVRQQECVGIVPEIAGGNMVFPEPFPPRAPTKSPHLTSMDTSFRAATERGDSRSFKSG